MKLLKSYINEGSIDLDLLNDIVISVVQNERTMYEKFCNVANSIAKKAKRDIRPNFNILQGSSVVSKLSKEVIDLYNKEYADGTVRLTAEERGHLKGYIAAEIFSILDEEFDGLTPDEQKEYEGSIYYNISDIWDKLKYNII